MAGKRINFTQKQSYNTRVYAAIVSFNSGGQFIREIHKKITEKSPGTYTILFKIYLVKQLKSFHNIFKCSCIVNNILSILFNYVYYCT